MHAIAHALYTRQFHSLFQELNLLPKAQIDPPLPISEGLGRLWGLPKAYSLQLLAKSLQWQILLIEADTLSSPQERRGVALNTWRHNPLMNTLWCFADAEFLTLMFAQTTPNNQPKFYSTSLSLRHPSSNDIERLLQLRTLTQSDGLEAALCDLMSQAKMTRLFFHQFQSALELLRDHMIDGPTCPKAQHDIALMTLLRLVILYFLQARGALDGSPHFIREAHDLARSKNLDFYHHTLAPLFFQALNAPLHTRSPKARALGNLPFLNGGLFEPLSLETQHPSLTWPSHVWESILTSLFERHRFALAEPFALDEHDAIDPEVLGRVFEGLMYGNGRKQSGSFYTPRPTVHQIAQTTIVRALSTKANIPQDTLLSLLHGHQVASATTLQKLAPALSSLTILDPAVGTGAFLIEALHTLRQLYRLLPSPPLDPDSYEGVRGLIHLHLHGVDINPIATRLCEVRLWLSLLELLPHNVQDQIPHLEPLPNLSHRINCGDSLLGPLELTTHRSPGTQHAWVPGLDATPLLSKIQDAQASFLTAHGDHKTAAKTTLQNLEHSLFTQITQARLASLNAQLTQLELISSSHDLFGNPLTLSPSQKLTQTRLEATRDALLSQTHHTSFCYHTRFAHALERGFDVILMNPPWVRAHAQDKASKSILKQRYQCASPSLWEDAADNGIAIGFGGQAELANLFMERALELLAPGGQLGALIPAKFLRSLQGSSLRGLLSKHTIHSIEDLSASSKKLFDATTYPAIVHVENSPPSPQHTLTLRLWQHNTCHTHTPAQSTLPQTSDPRSPWVLSSPWLGSQLQTMRHTGDPLGSNPTLRPRRGVMTGKNALFIHTPQALKAHFGPHLASILPYTKTLVQGRDIHAWQHAPKHKILWPYTPDGTLIHDPDNLPQPLVEYFQQHAQALNARSDAKPGQPLWQLFRVSPDQLSHKVVWKDLSLHMEASLVGPDEIVLNTAYFIPMPDECRAFALCALLQSTPTRQWFRCMTERAQNGWRRHFAWIVNSLPLPTQWAAWLDGEPNPTLEDLCNHWRTHPNPWQEIDAHLASQWGISHITHTLEAA